MDVDAKQLADVMKAKIQEQNLTIAWVARKSGVDYKTLHGFLSQGRNLSLDKLESISRSVGYELSELLTKGRGPKGTEEENYVIHTYRRLPTDMKNCVITVLKGMELLYKEQLK